MKIFLFNYWIIFRKIISFLHFPIPSDSNPMPFAYTSRFCKIQILLNNVTVHLIQFDLISNYLRKYSREKYKNNNNNFIHWKIFQFDHLHSIFIWFEMIFPLFYFFFCGFFFLVIFSWFGKLLIDESAIFSNRLLIMRFFCWNFLEPQPLPARDRNCSAYKSLPKLRKNYQENKKTKNRSFKNLLLSRIFPQR